MKTKKPENYYVDNKALYEELLKWRKTARDPDQRVPSEKLGQMLLDMHRHILMHNNFNRYRQDIKDECLSYSVYRILKRGLQTYDFSKKNPFGYFTRAIWTNYIFILKSYYNRLNRHQDFVKNQLARIDVASNGRLQLLLKQFGVDCWEEELKSYIRK